MKNLFDNKYEGEMINKLKSLEVSPPNGLWDEIDKSLMAKNRKRIILITSWASAATVAMLFTIWGIYSTQSKVQNHTSNNQNVKSEPTKKVDASSTKLFNSSKIESSRSSGQVEPFVEQNHINDSSIQLTELISQEVNNTIIVPEKLNSMRSTLYLLKPAKPIKIILHDDFNGSGFDQSIASVEHSDKRAKGNWFLSATGFPVYSFHSAGAMNKSETKQQTGIISWGGSISVRYAFANKISIETGLSYGVLGQQQKRLYAVYSDTRNAEVYDNSGFTNNYGTLVVSNPDYKVMDLGIVNNQTFGTLNESNLKKVDVSQTFRYLELPLQISKGFYYKGFSLYIKGGVSAGLLVRNQLDIKGSNIHLKGKTIGVDQFTASALTSVGVSIPVSKKANLLIEPSFTLSLKSFSNTKEKSYPFSSYIKFGIEIPI